MEGVLKRYFPIILKPIILTLIFFVLIVWIYLALSAFSPYWFTSPGFTSEIRAEEIARASDLGSFLVNLFRGNFGYSFMTRAPVWDELTFRFPTTLLLVGLSTVFSALIGVGVSMLFKPGKRKPSTFAHSLKGFFFGLAPFIALPFMLFFVYYLYLWLGFQAFPSRGLYSIPPPTDPLAYISDVLWHLFLPVATLTLIGVIRILLVVWSSGSAFIERALLKKILLPCTTFDFSFLISAVIIVEWFWTLPGVGRWFLNSMMAADYNVMVASFVVFSALAVGLGYLSVLLDFIQRLVGLNEDLEKKITIESKFNQTQTKEVMKNWVKLLLRKKRLMIGSAIVIVFLVLAIFAPFITPYDPMSREPVAQPFAMPKWAVIFPQFRDLPPSQFHGVLGTDFFGTDIFAKLVYGARTAVVLAFLIALCAVILGSPFGFLAGYFESWADNIIIPIIDALLCLSVLPILLVNVYLHGTSWIAYLPFSLLFLSALVARAFRNVFIVRSSNQKFKGATLTEQVLNVFKDLSANFCLAIIGLVLLLTVVEFLGFGDPRVQTWGRIFYEAFGFGGFQRLAWWWILPPVFCIGLFVLGLFLVGTGFEDESL
ncbi:MAG: hypothetical protein ACE5L6_05250 [Candidatus Bathyarchaeia archaeon]